MRDSIAGVTDVASDPKLAFPVVAIGMSAGGILPLTQLFSRLKPTTGMAFVVIHHLRKAPTLLPEILSKKTMMPIEIVSPGMLIRPNHVYVLRSGMELTTLDGSFEVRRRSKVTGFTNVFTLFLNSLSNSEHPGIAVFLSGVDKDGAAALKGFREKGGLTIAQPPQSAQQPEMPMAALDTGYVDHILSPESIAEELEQIAKRHEA